MGIAREELYEGGKALMRERFSNGQAMALLPVTVLEVNRGGARVRIEKTGREIIKKFSELEADHEWLDQRDRKEDEKRERIRRESIVPEQSPVRLVPPQQKPLTTSLGDLLKGKLIAVPPVASEAPAMPADPAVEAKEQGARLSLIREARDLSRGALARRAGYSESEVGAFERGESPTTADDRAKLAAALDVDVDELFDLDLALPDVTPFRPAEQPQASSEQPLFQRGPGRPSPYSDEVHDAAIKAYTETGEPLESIAERLGIKYVQQINRWIKQARLPTRYDLMVEKKRERDEQLSFGEEPAPKKEPELTLVPFPAPVIVPAAVAPPVATVVNAPPPPLKEIPLVMPATPPPERERSGTRRSFSDDFKYKLAREYITGAKSTKQIQAEYDVYPSTLYSWVNLVNTKQLAKPKASRGRPAAAAPPAPSVEQHDDDVEHDDEPHEVVELAQAPAPERQSHQLARATSPSQPPAPQLGRAVVMSDELQRLRAENDWLKKDRSRLEGDNERLKKEAREFLRLIGNRYE